MAQPHELYLIRHGLAEERGEKWPDDTKRPLTEQGIARLKKQARGLKRMGVTIDLVLTSPLVRARQTAEIIAAGLAPAPHITVTDALSPDGTHHAVVADLEKHARKGRIALVGHEPGIGELAARLIGARQSLEFKKGAICRVDFEELPPSGAGKLQWFLTPRILRSIKK